MSDMNSTELGLEASRLDSGSGVTAGALLRSAREAAGMHVASLAVSIKVPVKKLEALEADRFDLLPDAVFVRALASSVCRTLKIDPSPVLARLPQKDMPRLNAGDHGINAPFRVAGERRAFSLPAGVKKPVVIAVLLLLLAALAVLVVPEWKSGVALVERFLPKEEVSEPVAQEEVVVPVNAPAPIEQESSPTMTAVASDVMSAAPQESASGSVAVQAAQAVSAPAVVVPVASGVPQHVMFHAKASSWVEVRDAKGATLLRRNLADGEDVGLSGALPLSVVVGRADSTLVEVKGQPFSLSGIARNNVARFEVQ